MDDSDKAGVDFASKALLVCMAYEKTAYRDGFIPASLGINYTPCQVADAVLVTSDGTAIRTRGSWKELEKKGGKEEVEMKETKNRHKRDKER